MKFEKNLKNLKRKEKFIFMPFMVGVGISIPYFGRKGYPIQNVMAAYDFDMLFTFVLPGWEGAAHDTYIFLDTIRKQSNNFPHPPPGL